MRTYWTAERTSQCSESESESHSVSDSLRPHGLCSPLNSPGQNTGVGSLYLLQGISLTQGSKPALLHCRWILYQLSHSEGPSCNHLIYSWPMHISALIILRDSIGCFFYLFCFLPGWGTYPTHRLGQIKAEPQGLCN